MAERVFVDTNVLVYAEDARSKPKQTRAMAILKRLVSEGRAVLSTQILQEFFSIATSKLKLSSEQARERVATYSSLDVVLVRPELILQAIDLHRLHKIAFWDALVIQSASVGGCGTLVTADLNDGQTIAGVRIENPFR